MGVASKKWAWLTKIFAGANAPVHLSLHSYLRGWQLCMGPCAKKSAAPVGNNVGKAHDMYPSVLNSLMGADPLGGHETVGGATCHWCDCCCCTDCLTVSCSVIC